MKKIVLFSLLLSLLLLCACTSQPGIAESPESLGTSAASEVPTADETPVPTELPQPEIAPPAAEPEQSLPEREQTIAGTVENGVYYSDFFGLSFAFDDSWSVLNREEIARNMGYNEDYAYADISEVLSYHYPYVELWASNGLITVQIMVENLPITSDNGEQMNTPAEYMDNNAEFIPLTYENSGLSTSDMRRYQEDLCGYPFEAFFFIAEANGMKMPQTMMAAEKDGLILTIYITCIGEDQSGAVLSAFSAIPKE